MKSLQKKLNHSNIVMLTELIRENSILYFVFEYMEQNLYQVPGHRKTMFSEAEVRNLSCQVFQGLAYMHQKVYFHRDMKPENLLVTNDIVRLLIWVLQEKSIRCHHIHNMSPHAGIGRLRWCYNQIFIVLRFMWAMGAIMVELFTLRPLFPGTTEANQVYKIWSVLGSPTTGSWVDGIHLARTNSYQFPKFDGVQLSAFIPSASEDAINLIRKLCSWNPSIGPLLRRPWNILSSEVAFILRLLFLQCRWYGSNSICWKKGRIRA